MLIHIITVIDILIVFLILKIVFPFKTEDPQETSAGKFRWSGIEEVARAYISYKSGKSVFAFHLLFHHAFQIFFRCLLWITELCIWKCGKLTRSRNLGVSQAVSLLTVQKHFFGDNRNHKLYVRYDTCSNWKGDYQLFLHCFATMFVI